MSPQALPPLHVRKRTGKPVTRAACVAVSLALVLSGCKTMPTAAGESSAAADYATGCLAGALGGALLSTVLDKAKGRKPTPDEKRKALAKAAAGGCVVGLAATAIGKLMNQRQQAKHEEEMQKEARRRALEQQQYAAATQRAQNLPAATPAQRAARDAELERARVAYQTSINQPAQVDLGEGGQSTIQVVPSAPAAPGTQAATPSGCTDYSVLVKTAAGQARQYETWCPNSTGQMVRTDVRSNAA